MTARARARDLYVLADQAQRVVVVEREEDLVTGGDHVPSQGPPTLSECRVIARSTLSPHHQHSCSTQQSHTVPIPAPQHT